MTAPARVRVAVAYRVHGEVYISVADAATRGSALAGASFEALALVPGPGCLAGSYVGAYLHTPAGWALYEVGPAHPHAEAP